MKTSQSNQLGKISHIQGNVLIKKHGLDTERIPELDDVITEGDYLDLSHGSIEITINSGENIFLPQGAQFVINEHLINILLQNIGGSSDGMSGLLQEKRSRSFIQYYYTSLILLLLFGTIDILNQQVSSGIDFSLTEGNPSAGFETSPVLGIAAELFDRTYNQINSAINQQFTADLSTLLSDPASGGLQDTGFGFVSNNPNNLATDITAGVDTTNNNDESSNQNDNQIIFDDIPRDPLQYFRTLG